ncbi:MAG: DUF4115 domain-containing protein, partial [Thermodesulfovibrionaceae bacterium]
KVKEKMKKNETQEASKRQNKIFQRIPQWSLTLVIIIVGFLLIFLINQILKTEKSLPPPPTSTQQTKVIPKVEEKLTETQPQEQTLVVEATDKVWMRVVIDNREKKEFLLNPGEKIELKAYNSFKLHVGNAGGVKISFNGKEIGQIGKIGQVVHLDLPQDKN